MPEVIVAFDVDGTLTVRDCVLPFATRVAGRPRMMTILASMSFLGAKDVIIQRRDSLKERLVREVFKGRDFETISSKGEDFARIVHDGWMRRDTTSRLRWHQEQGHRVVLVSASLEPYLKPLGRMLGVDEVLCTRLEEDGGLLTGRLAGVNCRGPEKVRRLREWMSRAHADVTTLQYAYGDSSGDTEMLSMAEQPFFVSRTELERSA